MGEKVIYYYYFKKNYKASMNNLISPNLKLSNKVYISVLIIKNI